MNIFYSWQSDLPNSKTRGFIQDCIDAAIKHLSDIVFIEADRDTQGEFGSPDIVETVFSKIDECDLFIADVSIVNKYNAVDDNGKKSKAIKLSPNPNVLLELGYAAKALTWERVVCIMNTDYGKVGELPFDLEHRRPLQYSLDGQKKSAVKEYVRNIIVGNVLNAMEEGVRAKGNTANSRTFVYRRDSVYGEHRLRVGEERTLKHVFVAISFFGKVEVFKLTHFLINADADGLFIAEGFVDITVKQGISHMSVDVSAVVGGLYRILVNVFEIGYVFKSESKVKALGKRSGSLKTVTRIGVGFTENVGNYTLTPRVLHPCRLYYRCERDVGHTVCRDPIGSAREA